MIEAATLRLRCATVILACYMSSCVPPSSTDPLIERYIAATCVHVSANPKIQPHTREWDRNVSLRDGSSVTVSGAQVPGGRIRVAYPSGPLIEAADPGDYIYPNDVRMDSQKDLLYIRAEGLAGGLSLQIWLFEYDLHGQRILARLQVERNALPPVCADPQK